MYNPSRLSLALNVSPLKRIPTQLHILVDDSGSDVWPRVTIFEIGTRSENSYGSYGFLVEYCVVIYEIVEQHT